MASTNFDILHLRFARRVDDAVASASTAGAKFTVANRSDYLNRASKVFQRKMFETKGATMTRILLSSIEGTQSVTAFAAAGFTVPTDYTEIPLALVKTGSTAHFKYEPRKDILDNNKDANLVAAYTIFAGKLYAYQNGAILTSGAGTFYYIKNDEGTQGTTDIAINAQYWDEIVSIAVEMALTDTKKLSGNT